MVAQNSRYIGHKAAQTIYYAIGEHAARIGLPLTHLVTINFALTGIPPDRAAEAFSTIRRCRFSKWATRPCKEAGAAFPPTYAYWFENERNGVALDLSGEDHNVHVHWSVHLPSDRLYDFSMRIWEWVDDLAGGLSAANAVDIRSMDNNKGMRSYALKGAAPASAKHFGAEPRAQGVILGRRAGTSVNLGPSARRAYDRMAGITRRAA